MRSNHHAHAIEAPRMSFCCSAFRALAVGVLLLGGCGGSSGLQGKIGGTTSTAAGAGGGSQGSAGGAVGATGGQPAGGASSSETSAGAPGGGTVSPSGGASAGRTTVGSGGEMATGGRTSTGGASAATGGTTKTGGSTSSGGATGPGGTTRTGGTSTGGATTGPGGTTRTGGTSTGGSGGSSSAGGSVRGGATSSAGSTGTAGNPDAGSGDGGIVSSGYCEGDSSKLTYQGQTVAAPATDYTSSIVMDCCQGYGVNLHSSASLGFDFQVDLLLSINVTTIGEYEIGGTSIRVRAAVSKNSEGSGASGVNTQGSLRILSADTTAGLWKARLCLEVVGTTSPLLGTKIYVPEVIMGFYQSDKRFQIFLLKDATLRIDSAAVSQPLDSLELADSPLLDLGRITFVEKSTGKFGFTPGQKIGDSTRTKLGTTLGLPFVAVADGVRIYLGTFTSGMSSIRPVGPWTNVEEITPDGFVLRAPMAGPDPRNDERILKALSERGKLVP